MAMEESKVTKMKTPYQEWTEEVLNTSIRVGSIKPRSKVHKYTRAGKDGKFIVCPHCNKVNKYTRAGKDGKFIICPICDQGSYVFHFAWSALSCQHCDSLITKRHWKVTG